MMSCGRGTPASESRTTPTNTQGRTYYHLTSAWMTYPILTIEKYSQSGRIRPICGCLRGSDAISICPIPRHLAALCMGPRVPSRVLVRPQDWGCRGRIRLHMGTNNRSVLGRGAVYARVGTP